MQDRAAVLDSLNNFFECVRMDKYYFNSPFKLAQLNIPSHVFMNALLELNYFGEVKIYYVNTTVNWELTLIVDDETYVDIKISYQPVDLNLAWLVIVLS